MCAGTCTSAHAEPSFRSEARRPPRAGGPAAGAGAVAALSAARRWLRSTGVFAERTDKIGAWCAPERVTHASSIKRMEGDQVARQLRAAIVCGDKSGPESALSSLFFFFLVFLPGLFLHLCYSPTHTQMYFFWSRHAPPAPPLNHSLGLWAGTVI